MEQPLPDGARTFTAPSFRLIDRKPPRPGAILLAIVAAVAGVCAIVYAMGQTRHGHFSLGSGEGRSGGAAAGGSPSDDDDDPNQIDTIVLGDPADAPTPGKRGDYVSPVHRTIVVRLPRYGDEVGKIPDTPAGHLLWEWLAAFNQASLSGLADAIPSVAPGSAAAAQMELRKQTGGFNLLSAKEVQPGVLVFRMSDQTPLSNEVLGTLQVRENSIPAVIQSFSLRGVGPGPGEASGPGR